MKNCVLFLLLLLVYQLPAQKSDPDIPSKIKYLKVKIQETESGERLIWLDSLVQTVLDRTEFKYDSIARVSINFAIKIDSLSKASRQLSDLIYYHNYVVSQPEEGIWLYDFYNEKFKNLKNDSFLGFLHLYVADCFVAVNKLNEGIEFYKKALAYGKLSNNERLEALANLYMGYVFSNKGTFTDASVNFKKAAKIFTKSKDTLNLLSTKNALSILYSKNAFYDEAKKERDEAIEIAKKLNKGNNLISLYYNAAEDSKRIGDAAKQIAYLKLSIQENQKSKYALSIQPVLLVALTNAYAESDSLKKAEIKFKELEIALNKYDSNGNKRYYSDAKKTLSFAKGDYYNAIKHGKKYLEIQKERQKYEEIMVTEKFLSDVYKAMNENVLSNVHLVNYYKIKDSVSSVKNIKSLAFYQTLYETEKRDHKIENQRASIDLLNLKNENSRQLLIFGSLGLLVLFALIIFYRSYLSAKHRERRQQEFSQELIRTQENERTRIAKDLHDGVGQQITLLKMKAQNSNQVDLSDLAHDALEEVRSISRNLYPATLAKLGLTDSIEQLLLDLDEETEMFVSVEIDNVNSNFNDFESLNFYRFIQECVNNVLKHANAKTLIVNINKHRDGIKILIKDNGNGFDLSNKFKQNSLGLKTMAERITMLKGNFSINSKLSEGTSILVQIPF
ncbi:sensor histidine kinase [Flavobacteriaceae bacterium]|jgi:signal transduction histidine kinase|nr:sensor histidine kinase [Flavobacteriaceae bacterium]